MSNPPPPKRSLGSEIEAIAQNPLNKRGKRLASSNIKTVVQHLESAFEPGDVDQAVKTKVQAENQISLLKGDAKALYDVYLQNFEAVKLKHPQLFSNKKTCIGDFLPPPNPQTPHPATTSSLSTPVAVVHETLPAGSFVNLVEDVE